MGDLIEESRSVFVSCERLSVGNADNGVQIVPSLGAVLFDIIQKDLSCCSIFSHIYNNNFLLLKGKGERCLPFRFGV